MFSKNHETTGSELLCSNLRSFISESEDYEKPLHISIYRNDNIAGNGIVKNVKFDLGTIKINYATEESKDMCCFIILRENSSMFRDANSFKMRFTNDTLVLYY